MSAIGKYRHLVSVDKPGPSAPEDAGGYAETWLPLAPPTWWCSIGAASLRDLERVTGAAITQTATHLLRGRYHPQLGPECRVRFGARVFDVQSVHDREQRRIEIDVVCREATTAAEAPTRAPQASPAPEAGRPAGRQANAPPAAARPRQAAATAPGGTGDAGPPAD